MSEHAEPAPTTRWEGAPYEMVQAAYYACLIAASEKERRKLDWGSFDGEPHWQDHDEVGLQATIAARDELYDLYTLSWRERTGYKPAGP